MDGHIVLLSLQHHLRCTGQLLGYSLHEHREYCYEFGTLHGSALNAALVRPHDAIAEILLSPGADVNFNVEKCGTAALIQAVFHGNKDMVEMLLQNGAYRTHTMAVHFLL